jgi:8-oxo-dGTP diphosphatase
VNRPDRLESYSVILLEHQGRFLLLKRAPSKQFAPNQWTGVGGRVEPAEFDGLVEAALRELREETGIEGAQVQGFTLRRVVMVARPGFALTVLLYFTGQAVQAPLPACPEGQLAWLDPCQVEALDIVETSRPVLPILIQDVQRDPSAQEPVRLGVAVFDGQGRFLEVLWGGAQVPA